MPENAQDSLGDSQYNMLAAEMEAMIAGGTHAIRVPDVREPVQKHARLTESPSPPPGQPAASSGSTSKVHLQQMASSRTENAVLQVMQQQTALLSRMLEQQQALSSSSARVEVRAQEAPAGSSRAADGKQHDKFEKLPEHIQVYIDGLAKILTKNLDKL